MEQPTAGPPTLGVDRVGRTLFSREEVAELGRSLGIHRVGAGAPLLRQGEPVGHIGVIISGEVSLTHQRPTRRVVLQVLREGDMYGDVPLLCGLPMPFSARALTDAAVVELPHEVFWQLVEQRRDICRRLLFSMASRMERLQRRLLAVTSGDLVHQVGTLLLDEIGDQPGYVALSQSMIAELLGSTRPSVNRALHELAERGHVRLAYRRIEVVDPAGLLASVA
jgi:CRP/FNR family transcriptional regulator, cAMP and macrophage regulator